MSELIDCIDGLTAEDIIRSIAKKGFYLQTQGGGVIPPVPAVIYYVSTTGDNSNTGLTQADPWQTLAYADANAPAGSIIALKKGDTFSLTAEWDIVGSGTVGNIKTWDGSLWGVGANAVIQHNGAGLFAIVFMNVSYITFKNITFDGNNANTNMICLGDFTAGEASSTHHIIIQDCEIHDCGSAANVGAGIFMSPDDFDVADITILDNNIHDIGTHAIAVYKATANVGAGTNSNIRIENNTIVDWGQYPFANGCGIIVRNESELVTITENAFGCASTSDGFGISIEQAAPSGGRYSTDLIISYNRIGIFEQTAINFDQGDPVTAKVYGNEIVIDDTTSPFGLAGIVFNSDNWTGAAIMVNNNTIVHLDQAFGIYYGGISQAFLTLKNNIIYSDDADACLQVGNAPGNIVHDHNLYYKVGSTINNYFIEVLAGPPGTYVNCAQVQTFEPTAQCIDPLFVVTFADLKLQAGSPAINNGIAVAGYIQDINGYTVPTGGGVDIGANEKQ